MPDVQAKNIRGPQGPKGETGEAGPQGPAGQDGAQGPKGDPFTYDDFTPEQLEALRGPQGIQGPPGQDGAAGADGRGVTSIAYTSIGNMWLFTFSDGVSQQVSGPAIPAVSTSLNSTSDSTAASSSAVRMAYNLAATAMQRSGGTFIGKVTAAASSQLPTQYLLRNTRLSATALTPSNNGEICWVYG